MNDPTDNEQAFLEELREWLRSLSTTELLEVGRLVARLSTLSQAELDELDGTQR